jgi:hypothetical protein
MDTRKLNNQVDTISRALPNKYIPLGIAGLVGFILGALIF